MTAITLTSPRSTSPSGVFTPIQQILRTTAQHFAIPVLPVSPIRVESRKFKNLQSAATALIGGKPTRGAVTTASNKSDELS